MREHMGTHLNKHGDTKGIFKYDEISVCGWPECVANNENKLLTSVSKLSLSLTKTNCVITPLALMPKECWSISTMCTDLFSSNVMLRTAIINIIRSSFCQSDFGIILLLRLKHVTPKSNLMKSVSLTVASLLGKIKLYHELFRGLLKLLSLQVSHIVAVIGYSAL
jgi:hypothetical protein